ncbi:hypothetical protein AAHC03_019097 [Spirometra sp. Aus1]
MPSILLGYWAIRGLAQPIRLLLEYVGADYEEKRFGKTGLEEWKQTKYNLDGDLRISQSSVILRYLGEKYGLGGKNANELAEIAMAEATIKDLLIDFGRVCYSQHYDEERAGYMPKFKKVVEDISTFLGSKTWIMGDNITYADFILYEGLCVARFFEPSCFNRHANLKQYVERFEALPRIKEYMASDRFISWPLNGWEAPVGGGDVPPK